MVQQESQTAHDRNGEESGWTRVPHRKKNQHNNLKHFSIDSSLTTYFVSNLPEDCTNNRLWRLFENFGNLCDSFVSRKKDKQKNVFGFIKFKNVNEPLELEVKLKTVKWNGALLGVNLARFDRNRQPIQYGARISVSKAGANKAMNSSAQHAFHISRTRTEMSYKDACVGAHSNLYCPKTLVIPEKQNLYPSQIIGRSVLGEVINLEACNSLPRLLSNGGFHNVALSYVGGLKVLIVFKTDEVANEFITKGEVFWKELLSSVSIWKGDSIPFERLVSFKVWGVPFHLRDVATYESIGRLYGTHLISVNFLWGEDDNSHGSCIVISNSGKRIDGEMNVKLNGEKFKVWVNEDTLAWKPSFTMEEGEFRTASPEKVDGKGVSNLKNDMSSWSPHVVIDERPLSGQYNKKSAVRSSNVCGSHAKKHGDFNLNGDSHRVFTKEVSSKFDHGFNNSIFESPALEAHFSNGTTPPKRSKKRSRPNRSPSVPSPPITSHHNLTPLISSSNPPDAPPVFCHIPNPNFIIPQSKPPLQSSMAIDNVPPEVVLPHPSNDQPGDVIVEMKATNTVGVTVGFHLQNHQDQLESLICGEGDKLVDQ